MSFSCTPVVLRNGHTVNDIRRLRQVMPLKFFMKLAQFEYGDGPIGLDWNGPCTCRIDLDQLRRMQRRASFEWEV